MITALRKSRAAILRNRLVRFMPLLFLALQRVNLGFNRALVPHDVNGQQASKNRCYASRVIDDAPEMQCHSFMTCCAFHAASRESKSPLLATTTDGTVTLTLLILEIGMTAFSCPGP